MAKDKKAEIEFLEGVPMHLFLVFPIVPLLAYLCLAWEAPTFLSRRFVLHQILLTTTATTTAVQLSPDEERSSANASDDFVTTAYGRQEYTNAITASRDTNVSPAEAYDVIRQRIPASTDAKRRAADMGAGAGVSTAVLWREKGYRRIAAVDWSASAWQDSVVAQPVGMDFYEMDDATFFESVTNNSDDNNNNKFDVIVYNFAVNTDKAVDVARQYLTATGVLLAPCNDKVDYWYKQTYLLLDARGNVQWRSQPEVGAWSVQFQPDVTSPTCTGIWCGGFNGYQQRRTTAASSSKK